MSGFEPRKQESLKRRWQGGNPSPPPPPQPHMAANTSSNTFKNPNPNTQMVMTNKLLHGFSGFGIDGQDLVSVVPPVTVVLEGRSICHRISLHKHGSYQSLAKALRQMFVDGGDSPEPEGLDLSNAVPGHLIAYEDMENDLLLAGDLSWKDFVRVAKRIRILPVKPNSRIGRAST